MSLHIPDTAALLAFIKGLAADGHDQESIITQIIAAVAPHGIYVTHDKHAPPEDAAPPAEDAAPPAEDAAEDAAPPAEGAAPPAASTDLHNAPGTLGAAITQAISKDLAKQKQRALANIADLIDRKPDGRHVLNLGRLFNPEERPVEEQRPVVLSGKTVCRVMLSSDGRNHNRRAHDSQLYAECCGLILDARTWEVVAYPPLTLAPPSGVKNLNDRLAGGQYDVLRVDDGTVVTLYSWAHPVRGPIWSLATSKGYEVTNYLWTGQLTFAEVFVDLATRLYPDFQKTYGLALATDPLTGDQTISAPFLEKGSYTFGFRHHNFHPLLQDPERVWRIKNWMDCRGSQPPLHGIPQQFEYREAPGKTLTDLSFSLKDSLPTAVAAIRAGTVDAASFQYGYILRPRVPGGAILVESQLLRRVRKLMYESAPPAYVHKISESNRLEYNSLRAYLTANDRAAFLELFPAFQPRYHRFEEFVRNVVHMIVNSVRQQALAASNREPVMASPTGKIAKALLVHIQRHERLSAFHAQTEAIVSDYVVNPEYAFLFMSALQPAV